MPALPPKFLGFRHLRIPQYYSHHGKLYIIPASEREFSVFHVESSEEDSEKDPPRYPRGGHNYYGDRDMERLARRLGWIKLTPTGLADNWEERYLKKLEKEKERLKKLTRGRS